MNILLIEDDTTLNANICEALKAEGFTVQNVFDGGMADRLLQREHYDCVVLDVNLPGKNGFEICKDFRKHDTQTPVIMLTAFGELEDKVEGYDSGADDYLTKPFYMRELVLRVNSLIKRKNNSVNTTQRIYFAGDITLNDSEKKVMRNNIEVTLTPREYQILFKLMKKPGELVSKAELIKEIWGNSVDVNTNTIEVYVNFLRNKLDKPFGNNTIKTKVGYGYYLDFK